MKHLLFFTSFVLVLSSCKKESSKLSITDTHWYKLSSNPSDTLFSIYIPNAFVPNGDGVNDKFYPKIQLGQLTNFQIYSKANQVIFETSNYDTWNGRINNSKELAPIGTYTYQLKVKDIYGGAFEYTGSVLLFR